MWWWRSVGSGTTRLPDQQSPFCQKGLPFLQDLLRPERLWIPCALAMQHTLLQHECAALRMRRDVSGLFRARPIFLQRKIDVILWLYYCRLSKAAFVGIEKHHSGVYGVCTTSTVKFLVRFAQGCRRSW